MLFFKSFSLGRSDALACLLSVLVVNVPDSSSFGVDLPRKDIGTIFDAAEASGRVGSARKIKPVDARPAAPGEIIETTITTNDNGKEVRETETQSKPARAGDMVVRNRCPETGNEQYLVPANTFAERYIGPIGNVGSGGWREYHPVTPEIKYFTLNDADGEFVFAAPWGEDMFARSGDAIVRNPADPRDIYRVAKRSFSCTYKVQ